MAMLQTALKHLRTLTLIAAALVVPGADAFAGKSNVGLFLGIGGGGGASLGIGYTRFGKHGNIGVGLSLPIARGYDYDYYESPAYYHTPAYCAPPPPVYYAPAPAYYAPAPQVATYYEYRGHGHRGRSSVGVSVEVPIRVNRTPPAARPPRSLDYVRANAANPGRTPHVNRTWVPGYWRVDGTTGDRAWIAPRWEYR